MIQKLRTLVLVLSSVFMVNYFLNHNTGEEQEPVGIVFLTSLAHLLQHLNV